MQLLNRMCECVVELVKDVRGKGCEFAEVFTQCNDLLSQCNYCLLVLIRKFAGNCSFAGSLMFFFYSILKSFWLCENVG